MSKLTALAASLALSVGVAAPAHATGPMNPDKVEGKCNDRGGVYWPPVPPGHSYGCLNPDGSGIVCGGAKPGCDKWLKARMSHAQVRRTYAHRAGH
jgi:hypothetical protein